jgi:hypothetical protein
MTVTNLTVTGALTTGPINASGNIITSATVSANNVSAGSGTIGKWNIRDDRIGIAGRGDMKFETPWLKLLNYDTNTYQTGGGFASQDLWAQQGTVYANNVAAANLNLSDNRGNVQPNSLGGFFSRVTNNIWVPFYIGQKESLDSMLVGRNGNGSNIILLPGVGVKLWDRGPDPNWDEPNPNPGNIMRNTTNERKWYVVGEEVIDFLMCWKLTDADYKI